MLEQAKPDLINNQVHGCCNIAFQSCYFVIPWQHVLSWWFQQRSTFIKQWTVCSNMHEQARQQPCSSWPAQPCSNLSTTMFKLASSTMFKPVNRRKQAVRFYMCSFCWWYIVTKVDDRFCLPDISDACKQGEDFSQTNYFPPYQQVTLYNISANSSRQCYPKTTHSGSRGVCCLQNNEQIFLFHVLWKLHSSLSVNYLWNVFSWIYIHTYFIIFPQRGFIGDQM